MRALLFTVFLGIFAQHGELHAEGACLFSGPSRSDYLRLKTSAEDIEKALQVASVKRNPAEFCKRNLQLRYLNVNPKDSASVNFKCLSMSNQELEEHINNVLLVDILTTVARKGQFQPWWYSLIPTDMAQQLSLLRQQSFLAEGLAGMTAEQASAIVEEEYTKELNFLEKQFQNKSVPVVRPTTSVMPEGVKKDWDPSENTLARGVLCADLKLTKAIKCTQGLGRVLEIARPAYQTGVALSPVKVWDDFVKVADSQYAEGLRLMALKMTRKLKDKETKGANVFDDLVSSFREAGDGTQKAVDKAYNILALYGNGGANLGKRLRSLANSRLQGSLDLQNCNYGTNSVCGYLDIIGRGIPVLDYMSSKEGKSLYSFPQDLEVRCNTNKSYHFWMAAYLSRSLKEENFSADTAELAVYASNIGYHVNRNQGVADNDTQGMNALKKSTYDPVSNIIRADLSYARAGAAFGAGVPAKNISIDRKLETLMKSSSPSTEDLSAAQFSSVDQLKKYRRFREIFSPNALVDE